MVAAARERDAAARAAVEAGKTIATAEDAVRGAVLGEAAEAGGYEPAPARRPGRLTARPSANTRSRSMTAAVISATWRTIAAGQWRGGAGRWSLIGIVDDRALAAARAVIAAHNGGSQ